MAESVSRNREAFLKLIRYCEFGRLDDQDYYSLYNFDKFTDVSTHPDVSYVIGHRRDGTPIRSSPAGAYQIVYRTYLGAVNAGVAVDFTPASQDRIALWLIQGRGALADVDSGKIASAIGKLTQEWVSLPGGSHPKLNLPTALSRFRLYLPSGAHG